MSRLSILPLLVSFFACASPRQEARPPARPTASTAAAAQPAACPATIPGTLVGYAALDDGAALIFENRDPARVGVLRGEVASMAARHNEHARHIAAARAPSPDTVGGYGAGPDAAAPEPAPPAGPMSVMMSSQAEAENTVEGARLVFHADEVDEVPMLQHAVAIHARHMRHGRCPEPAPAEAPGAEPSPGSMHDEDAASPEASPRDLMDEPGGPIPPRSRP